MPFTTSFSESESEASRVTPVLEEPKMEDSRWEAASEAVVGAALGASSEFSESEIREAKREKGRGAKR